MTYCSLEVLTIALDDNMKVSLQIAHVRFLKVLHAVAAREIKDSSDCQEHGSKEKREKGAPLMVSQTLVQLNI